MGFVATPSPAPGVDESPLMTWGEIEGTPFQLESNETPLVPSNGPTFKVGVKLTLPFRMIKLFCG